MEVSLNQAFGDSQMAVDNYFSYISRQNNEQKEQVNDLSHSLNLVMEGVNVTGTVAAMAAKESMQSHNTIFGMLKMMNAGQGLLTQIIVDIKRNGGSTNGSVLGEALGGVVESVGIVDAIEAILLALGAGSLPEFVLPAMALLGGLKGATDQDDQNSKNLGEQTHPNSLTNKALEASAEAERFINGAYYSVNPAPNPLMNGPGMLLDGWNKKNFPAAKTFGEAMTVVAAINEANDYLEATGQIPVRPRIRDDFNPNDEHGNLMRYYNIEPDEMAHDLLWTESPSKPDLSGQAITLQPQSAVDNTSYDNSKREINVYMTADVSGPLSHIMGDVLGSPMASTWLHTLGRALAEQINDKLNSGGTLYSNNW